MRAACSAPPPGRLSQLKSRLTPLTLTAEHALYQNPLFISIQHRAVARAPVVVTVVRRERHPVLPPQRVVVHDNNNNNYYYYYHTRLTAFFPGQPGYKPVPESLDVN